MSHGNFSRNIINSQRQVADVVAQACYQIDIHGTKDATFKIERLPPHTHYDIPYRCLVPQKVENLLVAGRCISATHEALGAVRVQPICMATGQAAGTAAALCARHHTRPEDVSIAELQGKLSWTNESAHWIRHLYRLCRSRLPAVALTAHIGWAKLRLLFPSFLIRRKLWRQGPTEVN